MEEALKGCVEDDLKSDSTLGDDWVRDSTSSPAEPSPAAPSPAEPSPVESSSVESSPVEPSPTEPPPSETTPDANAADVRAVCDELKQLAVDSSPSVCTPVLEGDEADRYRRNWKKYLGVQNKPGVPRDVSATYAGKNAEAMREACKLAVERSGVVQLSSEDLERVVSLFCEQDECPFNPQWMPILEMLLPLRCSLDTLYNIFFAILTKFLPMDTTRNAICYHLMHLVLQYHDPRLSCHLDSLKITAYDFAVSCFSSLFACDVSKRTLYAVWDKYFEKGDPFMLFAMVMVFMMNSSEELLLIKDKKKILEILHNAAASLSPDDVDDFFDLSSHFLSQTPSSIKQDYQRAIFGSFSAGGPHVDVARLLALPIDPRDLIRMYSDENWNTNLDFNFFIIDLRLHDEYAAGHLDGSYNLDASLFVEAPDRYKLALVSLESYRITSHRNEHILFVATGHNQEDLYAHMVISSFLQNGTKHVAILQGGYSAVHRLLIANLERLDGHFPQSCRECESGPASPSESTPSRKSSWRVGMDSLLGAVKASAPVIGEKMRTIAHIPGISTFAAEKNPLNAHVEASQRHGKRYRNEPSVFTLSDSDSDANVTAVDPSPSTVQPKKLTEILSQDDILEHFEGVEVLSVGANCRTVGCHLALTRTHMHVFHLTEEEGKVIPRSRHAYGTVLRVSSKKKLPEMLTFKFGYSTDDNEYKVTSVQRFVLPRAGECAKAVKMNIVNMRPNILS